ncbi:MAG: CBASS cGAMP synthase [Magnetovibrionaceae bacterium]
MANVSKLLHNNSDSCLTKELNLTPAHKSKLIEARRDIRSHLRQAFHGAQTRLFGGDAVRPKFYTQGSFAYHTINLPAHNPPQQIDLDDGIYLPVSFLEEAGQPRQASQLFISFVDDVLRDLASRRNWTFVGNKDTCARLELDAETHVDIPMYAIPDRDFKQLQEKAMARGHVKADGSVFFSEALFDDDWSMIPTDQVHLAHRKNGWIASDPRVINDWFDAAVSRHGKELRRVYRYLKAWRDFQSPYGGASGGLARVSSILLMACAVKAYGEYSSTSGFGRDDQALQTVARHLPQLLRLGVADPADPDQMLTDRLTQQDRQDAISAANVLGQRLNSAIDTTQDCHRVVDLMTGLFGPRVPQRPDLVQVAFKSSPRTVVESHAPAVVAAPTIPRNKSA